MRLTKKRYHLLFSNKRRRKYQDFCLNLNKNQILLYLEKNSISLQSEVHSIRINKVSILMKMINDRVVNRQFSNVRYSERHFDEIRFFFELRSRNAEKLNYFFRCLIEGKNSVTIKC